MIEDDQSYYQRRAEAELRRAEEATQPPVALSHKKLAELYQEKAARLASSVEPR